MSRVLSCFLLLNIYWVSTHAQCKYNLVFGDDGIGNDRKHSLAFSPDSNYICVSLSSDSLSGINTRVMLLDTCGNLIWNRSYNLSSGGGENSSSVTFYNDSIISIAGYHYDPQEGASDGYLLTLNTLGDSLTYLNLDIGFNDRIYWHSIKDSSSYYLCGSYHDTSNTKEIIYLSVIDLFGNVIEYNDYPNIPGPWTNTPKSVHILDDKSFIITGVTLNVIAGEFDLFGMKVDRYLNHVWSNNYGDFLTHNYGGQSLLTDSSVYIVGGEEVSNSIYHALITKVDTSGTVEWNRWYNISDFSAFNDITQGEDGYIYVVGNIEDNMGGTDGWLLKLNSQGDTLDTKIYSYPDSITSHIPEDVHFMKNSLYSVGTIRGGTSGFSNHLDSWFYKTHRNLWVSVSRLEKQGQLSLFPNPTSTSFTIDTATKIETVKVYNHLGVEVLVSQVESSSPTIDVSHLPSGIYVVQLLDGETQIGVEKLIAK